MSIKIKLGEGGKVDPEVMRLLGELAKHRDACSICTKAYSLHTKNYCQQGMGLLAELSRQPSVSDGADLEKKINESN